MFQDISVEELLELQKKRELTLVDARSPSEYEESTIPGSLNIPLFDDAERAEIGTIYKQVSVQAAKDRGLEIVSAKLPAFIKRFEAIDSRKAVFCWRGGMRSKTTATVLSLMGIRVYRLAGGFRAYRKWVVDTLEHFEFRPPAYVVHGYTGAGKTEILRRLKAEGYPVIDLEGLAGHRGSIFGQIGLKANNQKTFESLLLHELLAYQDSPYVLFEAESKRVGKVVLPDFLVKSKEQGVQLFIDMPAEERVKHILEDYKPWEHQEACIQAFEHIKRRIHTPVAAEIEGCLRDGKYEGAVRMLLEHYYDPRYEHAAKQYDTEREVLKAGNVEEAVEAIKKRVPALQPEGRR
ncbi:tRNA 2-selenouridine(34) synthase MnmH [Paenibacillus mucilaginosus]|uniref:tRNA 2-selenouridine synthase n=2 Tax=Paenibacillus mucilaginosus TaxID=61624 RepID=H6NJP0_9BACL|nr:tRNA 2-selenouridine(34) synthase MnmH [Paenibacillus mucilaginosus]AEI41158.1 tRNA 2-selenouridine synthase [Paenibacillus mucilaginosus KNP414]AFC29720.1 tRNA 2-selenouridine synthase [Paenibacillus mucilaginosus 3016]MCG7211412.1 tRNA 2-selenouridine(34) synthase MnmH [Paenibacillus mucilaginosus]WDM30210.1 tRNA 2-selenouridine(34) synthase MnmH [Paenibacillus mucilaginosus]WFA18392.1 tRNA 2-selenouridine(34) synthase MnmH [Paenibacillus mucilaginosus]